MNRRQAIVGAVAGIAGVAGLRRAGAQSGSTFLPEVYMDDLRFGFERSYLWHSSQDDEAQVVATAAAFSESSHTAARFVLDLTLGFLSTEGFEPFEVEPDPLETPVPDDIDHNSFGFISTTDESGLIARRQLGLIYRQGAVVIALAGQGAGAATIDATTLLARRVGWPLYTLGGTATSIDDLDHLLPLVGTLPTGFRSLRPDRRYPG
jgi:hypothetical protein